MREETRVAIPNYTDFNSPDDFVSTLDHHLVVHTTGHPSRLNRKYSEKVFKGATAQKAVEELVAELGSAFVCAQLGYSYIEAQSPAYIEGWLKVLKSDTRAIFILPSQAADWLMKGPKVEKPAAEPEKEDAIPY
jgi:antirestriction protein ArdC